MPISLDSILNRFLQRLRIVDGAFERHVCEPSLTRRFDCFALQEGLLSNLWQAWNDFCREVLIASAQGATTRSGALTTSPYSGRDEAEISYVAKELSRRRNVRSLQQLSGRHLEPTWGDASKLNLISIGISASNSGSLASAFGGVSLISDLQTCRNACAHKNRETINSVIAARVRYNDTALAHPSQMMFWSDPTTNDFAWRAWVDEMTLVAEFAVA